MNRISVPKRTKPRALPIRTIGNPILRKRAERVIFKTESPAPKTPNLRLIALDLVRTCVKNELIGLAAPQIGRSLQMIVLHIHPTKFRPQLPQTEPLVMINPRIIEPVNRPEKEWLLEGCGSVPNLFGEVLRAKIIDVEWTNLSGKHHVRRFSGLEARVIQHEIDHLHGVLFIDKVNHHSLMDKKHFMKLYKEKKIV